MGCHSNCLNRQDTLCSREVGHRTSLVTGCLTCSRGCSTVCGVARGVLALWPIILSATARQPTCIQSRLQYHLRNCVRCCKPGRSINIHPPACRHRACLEHFHCGSDFVFKLAFCGDARHFTGNRQLEVDEVLLRSRRKVCYRKLG